MVRYYHGGIMENKENKEFKGLGILVLVTTAIGLMGLTFSSILLFFYPMLFLESSIKNGIGKTLGVMAISSLIVGLFISNPMAGMSLFFVFAPMILIFNYSILRGKSYKVVVALMLIVLILSVASLQFGVTPLGSIDVEEFIDTLVNFELEGTEGELSNLELSRLEENLRYVFEFTVSILPGMLLILFGALVYINYSFAARRLLRQGILINQPPVFPLFQVPRYSILILGVLIGLSYVLKTMEIEYYKTVYLNAIVVFGFLYFINGMALVNNLLLRTKLGSFARILIYMIIIFFPPVTVIVAAAGLIDALINFRKVRIKRE